MTEPGNKRERTENDGVRTGDWAGKGLMTRHELSEWLSVSERTIARLTADPAKAFPTLVVGRQIRFDPEDVKAWMRKEAVRTRWLGSEKGGGSSQGRALDASPEVEAIASDAPEAFRELAYRVDQLVSRIAAESDIPVRRELSANGARLMYRVAAGGQGSARTSFAAIDRIAARPSRGMRVRVLLDVARGTAWKAPAGWGKAGSGHWIMASIKPEEPLEDVRARVTESLEYVMNRVVGSGYKTAETGKE